IGANLVLQVVVTPVEQMLQNQHPDDDLRWRARPTASPTRRPARLERLRDDINHGLVLERRVDLAQPVGPQFVAVRQEDFEQTPLALSALNHARSFAEASRAGSVVREIDRRNRRIERLVPAGRRRSVQCRHLRGHFFTAKQPSSRGVRTDILLLTARVVVTEAGSLVNGPPTLPSELSGVRDRRMIIRMTTSRRPQQRYDHRLCDLVHNTGDVTIATNLGVPRSTAPGWLRKAPRVPGRMEVHNLEELQQEILELRRRVKKLTALLRLALALLRSSGFSLAHGRLPDGRDKARIVRAVDRARGVVPLRTLLRFLRLSQSRFHAWRRLQHACALDDHPSCPHTSPQRVTPP